MSTRLMTDFAAVVTDLDRMGFDLDDPLRHAKRTAKNAAYHALTNAVMQAGQLVALVRDMDDSQKGTTP